MLPHDRKSVGLYVHVPFCRSKCRYCGFYSEILERHSPATVVDAMIRELSSRVAGDAVKTVYLGGGSPSVLPRELLMRLVDAIGRHCGGIEEFTVEINPGQADMMLFESLRGAGVNRLSIGAQSFVPSELELLGRAHRIEHIYLAVSQAQTAGFENISLDLIFAIPGATLRSWKQSLNSAIGVGVKHISAYAMTWEEGTAMAEDLAAGRVAAVSEEADRAMYELAIDTLAWAGVEQYEISNFAAAGFQCRHNLNYWANGEYIGIGPGAASYCQGERSANVSDIKTYVEAMTAGQRPTVERETLGPVERACETAVLNLRRIAGIDIKQFKSQTGYNPQEIFTKVIQDHQRQGTIEVANGRIYLTREALPIADSVLCDFASV